MMMAEWLAEPFASFDGLEYSVSEFERFHGIGSWPALIVLIARRGRPIGVWATAVLQNDKSA